MTKWFHKCDKEWMIARQHCLTATDVKELLPVTKTGRKRVVGDEQYLKVLSRKLVNITDDDCVSTGAAARGHILEPYAIDLFNNFSGTGERLIHWDDIVIVRPNHDDFGLGFSPDAVNIEPPLVALMMSATDELVTIGEIKSYSAENHLRCGFTPKERLEERWQIATAMAVCQSIEHAHLMFYNPSMEKEMYVVEYARKDLEDEIGMVRETELNWLKWVDSIGDLDEHFVIRGNRLDERIIIERIMRSEALSPEGKKTVVE